MGCSSGIGCSKRNSPCVSILQVLSFFILFVFNFTAYILYIVHSTEQGARPNLGLSFFSPRVYIVTTLEDGSGIWTYSFRNALALSPSGRRTS